MKLNPLFISLWVPVTSTSVIAMSSHPGDFFFTKQLLCAPVLSFKKPVPQVYRGIQPHLGNVIVREQAQSSTTLSFPSQGGECLFGAARAVGSSIPLSPPATVMVISHTVCSQKSLCAFTVSRGVTSGF